MVYSPRRRGALIALAGTLVVAGCSNSDADPVAKTGASATATPTASSSAKAGAVTSPGEPNVAETGGPSVAVSLAPPVKVGKPGKILDEVRVYVGKIQERTVKAVLPGEIAGPAASATIEVRNSSSKAFSLNGLAITASYNKGTPAVDSSASPAKPLEGTLAPGKKAKGVYVFMVPRKYASTLRLEISSDESPTIVQFAR